MLRLAMLLPSSSTGCPTMVGSRSALIIPGSKHETFFFSSSLQLLSTAFAKL